MSVREIKERFMAHPWVYDTLRPLVIGWLDYAKLAGFCDVSPGDRVLDLGCGTGQLIPHLVCEKYLGVDIDPPSIRRARRFESDRIRFLEGDGWDDPCRRLDPTVVLMLGLVHHVSDDVFRSLIDRLGRSAPSAKRMVTFESTYFADHPLSNLLSRLDRGRFVRRPEEYERLFAACGLRVVRREMVATRLHIARYIGYRLEKR